jgi:hypothetical protein
LHRRNAALLMAATRALGGSLRYAVGHFPVRPSCGNNNNNKNNIGKTSRRKQQQQQQQQQQRSQPNHGGASTKSSWSSLSSTTRPRLRPVLLFDYENPHVYEAFKASGVRNQRHGHNNNHNGLAELEAALDADCTI